LPGIKIDIRWLSYAKTTIANRALEKMHPAFSIIESLGFGVLLIDADTHQIVYANPTALKMSGHALHQIINANCHRLVCPAELGRCPITDLGNDVDNSERLLLRADGTTLPIIKTVVPTVMNGKHYLIESFVDNSERKSLGEKLIQKNTELAEALQEIKQTQSKLIHQEKLAGIGQLAAGVAHEINNPLGFIDSNFESLAKYLQTMTELIHQYQTVKTMLIKSEPGITEKIDAIDQFESKNKITRILDDVVDLLSESQDGLDRISKIVISLRTFARNDEQNQFAEFDLNQGLQNVLILTHNEIKYHANVHQELSDIPLIQAVGGHINQVLLNIILNAAQAIKVMDRQEIGQIKLSTWHDVKSVYCAIEDNGVGISSENMDSIFNPFFTTKPVGHGTGLGLSISYDIIVNRHKGEITVESEPGKGAKFTIKLPIKHC